MKAGKSAVQPLTRTYEWGGPSGAAATVLFLPFTVLLLNSVTGVDDVHRLHELIMGTLRASIDQLPMAVLIEVVWLVGHGIFYLCPIGKRVKGMTLRNGKVLEYNINAIHAFCICHVAALLAHVSGVYNLAELTDMYNSLMLASILISAVMSVAFYIASYRSEHVLTALGGNSGCVVYDFWVGRELNPRTGFLDWKFMCELRPGLIGWSLLNWSFVCRSVQTNTFTPAIALIALFQSLYVVDGLLLEAGCLTMMDIVTDGFGFMLCFGDLSWVPFTYTLQAKYLASHPVHLHWMYLVMCVVVVVSGFVLFRGANNQKNMFRMNPAHPTVRHLKVMRTSSGRSLIVSGFWGVCRHPNYVGDWLMSLGWALLCGVGAAIPFFHPIYFGSLLVHRQLRDEEHMLVKYGEKDWKAFCNTVRYRLIPYIY